MLGTVFGLAHVLISDHLPDLDNTAKPTRPTKDYDGPIEPKSFETSSFTQHQIDVLVGSGLGDLHIRRRYLNASLAFKQSIIHKEYIDHLFELFKMFCAKYPADKVSHLDGKSYLQVYFETLTYAAFNHYHSLFYVNGVKIVPLNIEMLLTPRAIAYWYMDDGGADRSGVIFYTNGFTELDVQRLIDALNNRYGLNCHMIHRTRNGKTYHMIYVGAASWRILKPIIAPYIIPCFAYKLVLRGSQKKANMIMTVILSLGWLFSSFCFMSLCYLFPIFKFLSIVTLTPLICVVWTSNSGYSTKRRKRRKRRLTIKFKIIISNYFYLHQLAGCSS